MLSVSKNKCVGCGTCVNECPTNSIAVKNSVASIDDENCENCGSCIEVCTQHAIMDIAQEFLVAIGTDDGNTIKSDDHVGMSKDFQVWQYSNGELALKETRKNAKYREDKSRTHGDLGKAEATASVLKNIDVLIGQMFGPNISRLKNKFVCAVIRGNKSIKEGIDVIKENINEIIEENDKEERQGIILNDF